MGATPKQRRFAELILAGTMSATEAHRIAYPNKMNDAEHATAASILMKNDKIAAIISNGRQQVMDDIRIEQADLRRRWEGALLVDRNEFAEVRRVACRFCHGKGHLYQERPSERLERWKAHQLLLKKTPEHAWNTLTQFDELGGVGYSTNKDPHPDCVECDGLGVELVVTKDTRKLSPAARSIYEGIDVKNGGLVIKIQPRGGSMNDLLAKHLGMVSDDGMAKSPLGGEDEVGDMEIEAVYTVIDQKKLA